MIAHNVAEAAHRGGGDHRLGADELMLKVDHCRKCVVLIEAEMPIERLDAHVMALDGLMDGRKALIGMVFVCEHEGVGDVLTILIDNSGRPTTGADRFSANQTTPIQRIIIRRLTCGVLFRGPVHFQQ